MNNEDPKDEVPIVVKAIARMAEQRVIIEDMNIATEKDATYPSEWVKNNKGKKTPIKLLKLGTPEQIATTLHYQLNHEEVDPRFATRFMIDQLSMKPATLKTTWKTWGIKIGDEGKQITVRDLFEWIDINDKVEFYETAGWSEKQIYSVMVCIAGSYRYAKTDRTDYQEIIGKHIKKVLDGLMVSGVDFSDWKNLGAKLSLYSEFPKVMAICDMFLNEFTKHPLSGIRIGTICSRFNDCTVLSTTKYILKSLSIRLPQFALWIWTGVCRDQFIRVVKTGEEMDDTRSYSMYFMDLGWSDRSPYSTTMNPDLHFFYHALGVSNQKTRSINSHFVGDPEVNPILTNTMIMSYVLINFSKLSKQFTINTGDPKDEFQASDDEDESENQKFKGSDNRPTVCDPDAWFGYLQDNGFRVPFDIADVSYKAWILNPTARDESIGEFLYKRACALLEQ